MYDFVKIYTLTELTEKTRLPFVSAIELQWFRSYDHLQFAGNVNFLKRSCPNLT